MAAALSTTLRAALPVRPAARMPRSASTVVKRSSAVSTVTPSGCEQDAQGLGLVERGPGGRAGLAREAQGEPDDDRPRLALADGGHDGLAVTIGVATALDGAPRAGQCPPAVAVGDADAPGSEVDGRHPPARPRLARPRSRSRGEQSLRLGQRGLDLRGVLAAGQRQPRAIRRPRRPPACPAS